MQLCGIVYRQSILNVLELNYRAFCVNFSFCGKVCVFSSLRCVFAMCRLQFFDRLSSGVVCEAFFLGG